VNPRRIEFLPTLGNRSETLDILRLLALVLVLLRHSWACAPQISPVLHTVTLVLIRGGWIGVDLFFVLSGFLISGLIFKEIQRRGQISLSRFYLRRGFKIYPAFWVLILFTIALEFILNKTTGLKWIFSELLFVQNYGEASQWGYTWSLAVEEHFYIFLPIFLAVLLRMSSNREQPFNKIPIIFGIIAAACLLLRLRAAASEPFCLKTHLMATHLRFDSLFFGVLLSYYQTTTIKIFSFAWQNGLAGCLSLLASAFCCLPSSSIWRRVLTCILLAIRNSILAVDSFWSVFLEPESSPIPQTSALR